MKKLLPLLLLCCNMALAQNPITFNIGDIPAAGQTQRIAIDTFPLPTINFGSKGANQVYDFSNLVLYKYDTAEYKTPTSAQLSTCPNADVATTADGINFLLTNTDNANNKLILEGFEGQLIPGNTLSAAYSTKPDLFRFPTNYQNTFAGNAYLQKSVPGSQVGQPLATTVELTINTTYTDTIDGWGKVITPVGAYKCLRKKRTETTNTLIRALVFGFWNTVSNTTNTTIRYSYVTKEAKGSVINFNYDTANVLQSVNWSMVPPAAPTADFSFANGANGLVNFTDLSDGYPTQWAWTFGDGGTSASQNPSHTYTANGTYTVCLIATNAGGSSAQVCKQVTVSNAPVTPVANFGWANPSGGLVNFTDQSTNSPTQWAWTFGDGGTSNAQNPNHVYAANNTYNVCLTATNTAGSNQVCKNVTVTGISASNNAPLAVNDTVTVTGGSSQIIHVAGNDVDPDNDNLCMTAVWGSPYATEYIGGSCDMILYEPDSSFSGNDTCYYSVCDDGTPVLCDTGMVVFTVNELNLPPVAVNDAANVTQPNSLVVNVGTNDSDPNGNNICVTAVYGSAAFAVAATGNCTSVEFSPDSTFTGNDTCWYILCDNGTPVLCDTGMLVVTSTANPALLPVASFVLNSIWCQGLECINTSTNADSIVCNFHVITGLIHPDIIFINEDTMNNGLSPHGVYWEVCLTAYNAYGSVTVCDSAFTGCESISEIALSNISLYPNPAGNMLTIDMTENGDEITRSYTSIEVYNTLGEMVKAIQRKNEGRIATFSVADLANGMYVATLTGANGQRSTLGRFTVNH